MVTSADPPTEEPLVSVIMPIRQEAGFIGPALRCVLDQELPGPFEVIVVDGCSTDATLAEARGVVRDGDPVVVFIDNPGEIVPISMNLGLAAARAPIVVRVDGHCEIPPGYLSRCLELLDEHPEADCVGGELETVGHSPAARGIAAAQSSTLGVGNATFRTGATEGRYVDTLAFGAYRQEVFGRIGGFDEELVRNQDDELNLRLTQAGGKLWLDPSLVVRYHSRASLKGLRRQYFQYGQYKVRVLQKRHAVASLRHLVPALFVVGAGGSLALGGLLRDWRIPALVLVPYAAVCGVAAAPVVAADPAAAPTALAAVPTMHVSYGTGFLSGVWRWRKLFRSPSAPVTLEPHDL